LSEGRDELLFFGSIQLDRTARRRHDVLRRANCVITITGLSWNGGRVASVTDKTARSIPSDDSNLIDSHVVTVADGIRRLAETFDVSEVVPRTICRNPSAIGLTASNKDNIGRPGICTCCEGVGAER